MQVKDIAKFSPEDRITLAEEEVLPLLKWHGIGVDSAHEREFLESLRKYSLLNLSINVLWASEAWGPKLISKLVTLGLAPGEDPLEGLARIVGPSPETYVVVGIAFRYYNRHPRAQREKTATGNAKWNVRAFQSSQSAEAFAQQLNAWCAVYDVDAGKLGDARRETKRANREADRKAFEQVWHAENIGFKISEPRQYTHLSYYERQRLLEEDYKAFLAKAPTPELGHPPEDPQFLTSYDGTEYIVEALPTYA